MRIVNLFCTGYKRHSEDNPADFFLDIIIKTEKEMIDQGGDFICIILLYYFIFLLLHICIMCSRKVLNQVANAHMLDTSQLNSISYESTE